MSDIKAAAGTGGEVYIPLDKRSGKVISPKEAVAGVKPFGSVNSR